MKTLRVELISAKNLQSDINKYMNKIGKWFFGKKLIINNKYLKRPEKELNNFASNLKIVNDLLVIVEKRDAKNTFYTDGTSTVSKFEKDIKNSFNLVLESLGLPNYDNYKEDKLHTIFICLAPSEIKKFIKALSNSRDFVIDFSKLSKKGRDKCKKNIIENFDRISMGLCGRYFKLRDDNIVNLIDTMSEESINTFINSLQAAADELISYNIDI